MKTKSDKFKISDRLKVAVESTQNINLDRICKAEWWAWIWFISSMIFMCIMFFVSVMATDSSLIRSVLVATFLSLSTSLVIVSKNTGNSMRIQNMVSILRGDIDSDIILTPAMVYQNFSELVRRVVLAEQVFMSVNGYEHHTEADLKHFDGRVIVVKQNLDTFVVNMKCFGIPCDQKTKQSHFDRWAPSPDKQ